MSCEHCKSHDEYGWYPAREGEAGDKAQICWSEDDGYDLILSDASESVISVDIQYCPWCGEKLTNEEEK